MGFSVRWERARECLYLNSWQEVRIWDKCRTFNWCRGGIINSGTNSEILIRVYPREACKFQFLSKKNTHTNFHTTPISILNRELMFGAEIGLPVGVVVRQSISAYKFEHSDGNPFLGKSREISMRGGGHFQLHCLENLRGKGKETMYMSWNVHRTVERTSLSVGRECDRRDVKFQERVGGIVKPPGRGTFRRPVK